MMASAVGTPKAVGASDRIRVGAIGTGGMGRNDVASFAEQPDVEIVAVCDVYQPHLDEAVKVTDGKAKAYKDFREVLDRKDIDAIIVATPDHWHALLATLACQAGKDVYEEKPIATSFEEGRRMVEVARKYNRVVQVNTHWRSWIHCQKAVESIQDGLIGKISFVKMWNYLNFFPEGIGTY